MNHLANGQFSEIAIGIAPDRACELHLAECAHCREELEKFSASVGLFSRTSLAWSEIKNETAPATSPRPTSRWQTVRWAYAPVGWALAAAVLIMVGVPAWKYDHRTTSAYAPAVDSATEDSPAEIAQDNALLQSVNVALNTSEDSPLPEYRLSPGLNVNPRFASRVR